MTYRPLLERVGRGRVFGGHSSKKGKILDSDDTRQHNASIPLKPRLSPEARGFHQLGNDLGVDPSIIVTTNIHVGNGVRDEGWQPPH